MGSFFSSKFDRGASEILTAEKEGRSKKFLSSFFFPP